MKDRIPTLPNRYLLTDAESNSQYVTLTRADAPTEAGTALNKANLLSDTTAAKIFKTPTGNETIDGVLAKLGSAALVKTISGKNSLTDIFGNDFPLPVSSVATGSFLGTGNLNPVSLSLGFTPDAVLIIGKMIGEYWIQYQGFYYTSVYTMAILLPSFGISYSIGNVASSGMVISSILDISNFTNTVTWQYRATKNNSYRFNSEKFYFDDSDVAKQLANLSARMPQNNSGDTQCLYKYIALKL